MLFSEVQLQITHESAPLFQDAESKLRYIPASNTFPPSINSRMEIVTTSTSKSDSIHHTSPSLPSTGKSPQSQFTRSPSPSQGASPSLPSLHASAARPEVVCGFGFFVGFPPTSFLKGQHEPTNSKSQRRSQYSKRVNRKNLSLHIPNINSLPPSYPRLPSCHTNITTTANAVFQYVVVFFLSFFPLSVSSLTANYKFPIPYLSS